MTECLECGKHLPDDWQWEHCSRTCRDAKEQQMEWPEAKAEHAILGFVVNPKLSKLALACWEGRNTISILGLDESAIGDGYYEADVSAQITGFPRVHTPSGVTPEGQGYGTTLYTSLALGAALQSQGTFRIRTYDEGEGISSREGNRSAAAESWWSRAKRLRLASSVVDESEDRMDIAPYIRDINDCVDTDEITDEGGQVQIGEVLSAEADVLVTRSADAYPYQKAVENNLIALAMPIGLPGFASSSAFENSLGEAWKHVSEADGEIATVLAADVRDATASVIRLLLTGCRAAGASDTELDELHFRWKYQIDPKVPFTQLRLPFSANGADAIRARAVYEKTAFLRSETGWSELAELP